MPIAWAPTRWDGDRDPLIDAAVGLLGELNGVYRVAPDPENTPAHGRVSPLDSMTRGRRTNGERTNGDRTNGERTNGARTHGGRMEPR
jgi:hypothetical protein